MPHLHGGADLSLSTISMEKLNHHYNVVDYVVVVVLILGLLSNRLFIVALIIALWGGNRTQGR